MPHLQRENILSRRKPATLKFLLIVGCALASGLAHAGSMQFGDGFEADYKLTMNYGVAMRMQSPSQSLINGPVDPFQLHFFPGDGTVVNFTHTGLSNTINLDDGDRNFKKHALINNRVSAYGEFSLNYENYGLVLSGDAFYDDVYNRRNDNNSPNTINKSEGDTDQFTASARRVAGRRARLLDAYLFGDWALGDTMHLNLRVGEQVVAWGESLFFSGIALAQGRADATRAFVPGAEIKEILLPTNQASMQLGVNEDLTLLAYYQFEFKPSEIFPAGHYFSPADPVGPGSEFAYGSLNPLYLNGCPGLLPPPLDQLCNLNGLGGPLLGATPYIITPRGDDINPKKGDQWGTGLSYRLTPVTTIGLYRLRYADSNPTVHLNSGYPVVGNILGIPLTTHIPPILDQPTPVSYNVQYWGGIDMTALTLSTDVGPVNVAGELSYRQGLDMQVQATPSGVLSPIYTRGDLTQILMSGIYTFNPKLVVDELTFVGEAGLIHVEHVEAAKAQPGIPPVGNGTVLFADNQSVGAQTLVLAKKRNVINGWDASGNFSAGKIFKGDPAMAGAFGSLYGEKDARIGVGFGMQYLQNLEFGLSYNWFFGDPSAKLGKSPLPEHPFSDRDYVSFNVKYSL